MHRQQVSQIRFPAEMIPLGLLIFVLLRCAISLSTERQTAIRYVRSNGYACMALVDPTAHEVGGKIAPMLEGVDATAAVYLNRADPEGSAMLNSLPMASVTILDSATYQRCFKNDSNSETPVLTDAIFLNGARLSSAERRTVAIAHELVHVQHNHPEFLARRHRFLHLVITEEGESHLKAQIVAWKLHTRFSDNPFLDFVFDIATLPLLYISVLVAVFRFRVLSRSSAAPNPLN